jgi:archaellum component FlaF (FlaF/FlaG flagellin family)
MKMKIEAYFFKLIIVLAICADSFFGHAQVIGCITDEKSRTANVNFDHLSKNKKIIATIYMDAKEASWNVNPQKYTIKKVVVSSKSDLKQYLAPGGGFSISIKGATRSEIKEIKKL